MFPELKTVMWEGAWGMDGGPPTTTHQKKIIARNRLICHPDLVAARNRLLITLKAKAMLNGKRAEMPKRPIEGPMAVTIIAGWPYAKATPARIKAEQVPIPYVDKPDADNFAKLVLDVMMELGVIRSDASVAQLSVIKMRCPFPGLSITVEQ